jgi:murein DD-endopeptidase MepM/ murein hydrolase activator NlpD
LTALAAGQESNPGRFEKVMGRLVKAINESNYPAIRKEFAPAMEEALPPKQGEEFFAGLLTQYGKIQKFEKPTMASSGEAVFVAHFERGVLDVKIWLDDKDKISGLLFLPHVADIPVPEKMETLLSLPFKGQWLVFWGGDTPEQNQHHNTPNQKFAFDFLGVNEKGQTRKGESQTNEDFFAFGREVLAPANGEVTDVIGGVRDNTPGSMNPYSALGNAVFIQHGRNEISVLAHLKQNSVMVKVGDKVKKGQVIGLCGNSGNSSEPHLHFHVQNTPIIQDGTGIKCYFQKLMIKGDKEPKINYSPVKDQIISVP